MKYALYRLFSFLEVPLKVLSLVFVVVFGKSLCTLALAVIASVVLWAVPDYDYGIGLAYSAGIAGAALAFLIVHTWTSCVYWVGSWLYRNEWWIKPERKLGLVLVTHAGIRGLAIVDKSKPTERDLGYEMIVGAGFYTDHKPMSKNSFDYRVIKFWRFTIEYPKKH